MTPVLWQLKVSPYNEKARWALDHKQIPHVRRSVQAGPRHQRKAKQLTGGEITLPILELEGRVVCDSRRIVAALEDYKPEPALYPADPGQRERALEIEEHFEEVGHQLRRVLFVRLFGDKNVFFDIFGPHGGIERSAASASWPLIRRIVGRQYRVSPESAEEGLRRVEAAFEMIEREAGPGGFLVGDSFSVADLSAASILYPIVLPPDMQYPPLDDLDRLPEDLQEVRASLSSKPGWQWVLRMFAEHRGTSAEVPAAAAA